MVFLGSSSKKIGSSSVNECDSVWLSSVATGSSSVNECDSVWLSSVATGSSSGNDCVPACFSSFVTSPLLKLLFFLTRRCIEDLILYHH